MPRSEPALHQTPAKRRFTAPGGPRQTCERLAVDRPQIRGHDTRALQAYLGHRNIQHTVRYTELTPTRFKDFWRA